MVQNVCEKFRNNRMDSLIKLKRLFLSFRGYVWLFLTSQSYDFDTIAHAGAPLGVE